MDVESDSAFSFDYAKNRVAGGKNTVKFYAHWKAKAATLDGEYRDYVLILCPGMRGQEVRREAKEQDKIDYPEEWRAYKDGRESFVNGTPIELLPGVPKGMLDAAKALNIVTIQQLAELSDSGAQTYGHGAIDLRRRAKEFLSQDKTGELALLRQEAKELREQIAALQLLVRPQRASHRGKLNVTIDDDPGGNP